MKIDYKEKNQKKQDDEPLWLSIATGFACFCAILVTINLFITIEWLIKL